MEFVARLLLHIYFFSYFYRNNYYRWKHFAERNFASNYAYIPTYFSVLQFEMLMMMMMVWRHKIFAMLQLWYYNSEITFHIFTVWTRERERYQRRKHSNVIIFKELLCVKPQSNWHTTHSNPDVPLRFMKKKVTIFFHILYGFVLFQTAHDILTITWWR